MAGTWVCALQRTSVGKSQLFVLVLCLRYRLLQTAVSASLTQAVRGGCPGPWSSCRPWAAPTSAQSKNDPGGTCSPFQPLPWAFVFCRAGATKGPAGPNAGGDSCDSSWCPRHGRELDRPGGQPSCSLRDVRSHTRCFVRHYLRQTRPLTLFSDSSPLLPSPAEVQITSFMGTNVTLDKRLLMDTERLISLFVLASQFYGPMLYQRSSLQSLKPMRIRSVTLE